MQWNGFRMGSGREAELFSARLYDYDRCMLARQAEAKSHGAAFGNNWG